MNTKNIKILNYFMLSFIGVLLFMFYFQLPFRWDDWHMSNMGAFPFRLPFEVGDNGPGRHFSRFMMILSPAFLAPMIDGFVQDMYVSMKIGYAIVHTVTIFTVFYLIKYYTSVNKIKSYVYIYIYIALTFMLRRFFYEPVASSEYIGGLALALLVWTPFVYFYKNQQLPEWLSKDPNKAIGFAIPM